MNEKWDFSKLPDSEIDVVSRALNDGDVRTLVSIHDKYGLSSYSYCCDQSGVIAWFSLLIKTKMDDRTAKDGAKKH